MIDSIIFDLDGTLWNSVDVVLRAWNELLERDYKDVNKKLTKEDIEGIMGLQLDAIGERFFPSETCEKRMEIMMNCCNYEVELIKKSGAILFPKLEETLKKLSEKYPLFIVSNCQIGYIESFYYAHKMEKYFKDFTNPGITSLSKGENIKLIIEKHKLKNPIYVGDTEGDKKAAKIANVPFIYASYGFGKLTEYDYKIDNIHEILSLIKNELEVNKK